MPELLICLVQLEILFPGLIHESYLIPMLSQLLDYMDKFNRLAPGLDKEDSADLLWHRIPSKKFCFLLKVSLDYQCKCSQAKHFIKDSFF